MTVAERHHVTVSGRPDAAAMVFAHGLGCDQSMWRHVAPLFEDRFRVVLFDHIGCGASDPRGFDPVDYATLDRYADDVLAICAELGLRDVVFVGHSVSSIIGVLAQVKEPDLFAALVLVGPSPRYLDDGDYVGGFSRPDIDELLELMDANLLGWQQPLAGLVMTGSERADLTKELEDSFCRTDQALVRHFARVTFLSDNRADLGRVTVPTLVVQSASDVIAAPQVGEFVRDHVPGATLALIDTVGHCPHLSAPEQTFAAIDTFLRA